MLKGRFDIRTVKLTWAQRIDKVPCKWAVKSSLKTVVIGALHVQTGHGGWSLAITCPTWRTIHRTPFSASRG